MLLIPGLRLTLLYFVISCRPHDMLEQREIVRLEIFIDARELAEEDAPDGRAAPLGELLRFRDRVLQTTLHDLATIHTKTFSNPVHALHEISREPKGEHRITPLLIHAKSIQANHDRVKPGAYSR